MTIEELQILITANSSDLRKEIVKTQSSLTNLERKVDKTNKGIAKGFRFLKGTIVTLGIGMLIASITRNLDGAINRFDTLNNYGNTMANLGIGAADSERSIDRLQEGLAGLPTVLDDAALSVQRFTASNGNIKASTEFFLSLNNAVLAGNAPIESQRSAIEQLTQAYSKGKPDMMEWRSLQQAMPAQLNQIAQAMGFVSADALGESLRSGSTSMNDFMIAITRLNKEGVGGFASFEEQARNSTGGIRTSITNMRTSITRGITDIMNVIGQSNIAGFFNAITRAINSTIPYIAAFVKLTMMAVTAVASLFGGTSKTIKEVNKNVGSTSKAMGGLGKTATTGLDKATGSAKKLNKELGKTASFDELFVMDQKSDESSGILDASAAEGLSGAVDMSGLDFDWSEQTLGASKLNSKVEELLGFTKGIGAFIDKYKVPIISTLAAVTGGLAALGIISMIPTLSTFFGLIQGGVGLFSLWIGEMGLVKGSFDLLVAVVGTSALTIAAIVGVVMAVVGALTQLWQTNEKFKASMINAWTGIKDTMSKVYDSFISPILSSIKDMFINIWDYGVKPLWDGWVEFVGSVSMAMAALWEYPIKPFVDYIIETFGPILTGAFDIFSGVVSLVMSTVGNAIGTAFKNIGTYITGLIGMFQGIITFLTGVFTGDWSKAWEGVKKIFSSIVGTFKGVFENVWNHILKLFSAGGKIFDGMKDGIVRAFSSIVNSIISGINKVISIPFNTINSLLNTIRNVGVLGVKPFKGLWSQNPLPVPQIPKLPAYEKGTNYVPETGFALLHKGETVKPAKQGKPYESNEGNYDDLIDVMIEQNEILISILEKDTNVYMNNKKVSEGIDKFKSIRQRALGLQG